MRNYTLLEKMNVYDFLIVERKEKTNEFFIRRKLHQLHEKNFIGFEYDYGKYFDNFCGTLI